MKKDKSPFRVKEREKIRNVISDEANLSRLCALRLAGSKASV